MVQWLGLGALTAGALGSIPGRGTKILQEHHMAKEKRERETATEFKGERIPLAGAMVLNPGCTLESSEEIFK